MPRWGWIATAARSCLVIKWWPNDTISPTFFAFSFLPRNHHHRHILMPMFFWDRRLIQQKKLFSSLKWCLCYSSLLPNILMMALLVPLIRLSVADAEADPWWWFVWLLLVCCCCCSCCCCWETAADSVGWFEVGVDLGKLRWISLVCRIRRPIRMYNRTKIHIGKMKNRNELNSCTG